jgi:hypothetical protein
MRSSAARQGIRKRRGSLEPGRGVFGSRQTRSFLASTRGVRIPGFLGDAADQRVARVAEIGRWVAGLGLRSQFGSDRLALKPLSDHASFSDRARTGLRNVLLRHRRHELCLGGSMTSRQATTVAMSSRRPRRQ